VLNGTTSGTREELEHNIDFKCDTHDRDKTMEIRPCTHDSCVHALRYVGNDKSNAR
jgi:hypothetical protein